MSPLQGIARLQLLLLSLVWSKMRNPDAWFLPVLKLVELPRWDGFSPFKLLCYSRHKLSPLWQTLSTSGESARANSGFLSHFGGSVCLFILIWCVFSWIVRSLYLGLSLSLLLALVKYTTKVRAVWFFSPSLHKSIKSSKGPIYSEFSAQVKKLKL